VTDQTETARFRHRTTEIEAVQWTGSNADALRAFCGPDFDEIEPEDRTENPDASAAVRESKHGTWRGLEPGYWVVKIGEEFYEESPADFAAQFEPVPSAVPAPAADRAEPVCKFDAGCHRVVACEPGCAVTTAQMYAQLAAAPAETALRDRIAAAIYEHMHPGSYWSDTSMPADWRPTYLDEADAVLAVLSAVDLPAGEAYRLAVSAALRLGTGATWEAIRDRAEDLTAEAEGLTEARATNRRLNLRAQKLESELAAYRRAVADWKISDSSTYVPLRSIAAIAKAAGVDVPERWTLHYERVEQAEAAIERVREVMAFAERVVATSGPGPASAVKAVIDRLRAALDPQPAVVPAGAGEEPAAEAWDVPDARPGTTDHTLTRQAATVDPAMCPRCKGDNREAFALCPACAEADGRLLCPRCREDITDYDEDDHVFRTGDERPYCSGECVVAAHRAEAEQRQSTPCGPAPDECDAEAGELCAVHEREEAHAEGEHCFCGSECDKACTCGSAGDAFVPIGHYADCPQATEPAPAVPQCDGCGHLVHRARKCPAVRYGERCECDEPLAASQPGKEH
jgi:hypothetical protein